MAYYAHVVPTATTGIFLVDNVIRIDAETLATGHWDDPSEWILTSYGAHGGIYLNGAPELHMNYAGKGMLWEPAANGGNGAFYQQQPYPSWTLNAGYEWEAPTPEPAPVGTHKWDEATLSWVDAFPGA